MRVLILGLIIMLFFSASLPARIGGGDIIYEAKKAGKVVFSHDTHVQMGMSCTECHQAIFEAKVAQAGPHKKQGKACVVCHNGKKAFNFATNCNTCHQKEVR